MDFGRILIASAFCAASLNGAPNAEEIYQKTVKVLSFPKIKFEVDSILSSGNYSEKRQFTLSRSENSGESSLLICFSSPSKIKGTGMLLKKNGSASQTYVYFPALDRVRLIPRQNENEEAFGLGISYSEMQNGKENLELQKTYTKNGQTFYQIAKLAGGTTTVYTIAADTYVVKKMEIFENGKRDKEVMIDEVKSFKGKPVITKWHISDYQKQENIAYEVNEESMQSQIDDRIFSLSALTHCKP